MNTNITNITITYEENGKTYEIVVHSKSEMVSEIKELQSFGNKITSVSKW